MAEYIPGPWRVEESECSDSGTRWSEWAVTSAVGPVCSEIFLEGTARLIAADPELLEALRWFVDDEPCRLDHEGYCQTHGVTKPCLNQAAGMVILKAEGRQPVSGGMSDDEYYDGLRDAASL